MIPAKPDHLDLLDLRGDEANEVLADGETLDRLKHMIEFSSSGTLLYKGVVVALFGYFPVWEGVLEVWILPSKYVEQFAIPFLRTAKRYIKALTETHRPHRIQSCSIDDVRHEGWMRFLGFEKEGTLKNYTATKQDYCQWAITRFD